MQQTFNKSRYWLGWDVEALPNNATKILEQGDSFSIVELPNNEKRYCLNSFPRLSWQEQTLLCSIAGLFQKKPAKPDKDSLRKFFKNYCIENLLLLERKQVEYLLLLLEKQVFGFGPLDFLLADNSIEEIAVIGIRKEKPVHVFHKRHGWLRTNLFFSSSQYVKDLVNKMSRSVGRRLSLNSPILNAALPDGNRLSAAIDPVSFGGPSLTIRRFKQKPFTPVQLMENQTFSPELMSFLWIAMQCDCNILIAGNTGSGKTSSLNALLSFVPKNERLVVVEETPEIRVYHKHFVKLNVVREQRIGMQNLIVESLRMRPDRIIVGEVRSREEAAAFIDTMLAGQGKGSYATFHGQSVRETVNRLNCLGVAESDMAAIDLVLLQKRWNRIRGKQGNKEVRRVVEVAELQEKNGRLEYSTLFSYDYGKDRLVRHNESRKVFEKARKSFLFDKKGWQAELRRRKAFLNGLLGKEIELKEFFNKVNLF